MATGPHENWNGDAHCVTFLADADMSASVHRAVKIKEGGNLNEVTVIAAAVDFAHGVLVTADGTAAGVPVKVMTAPGRIVRMEASAAIATVGDLLMLSANGRVLAHTGAVSSIGRALQTAGGAGEIISVFWWPEKPTDGV